MGSGGSIRRQGHGLARLNPAPDNFPPATQDNGLYSHHAGEQASRMKTPWTCLLLALAGVLSVGADRIAPVPPLPTPSQRAWQELELTMFVHFGVNTFSDREWGDGKEDPRSFNPVGLETRQWVDAAKAGGFKLMILTAKHHDGFCLWPSKFTDHSVQNAAWKDGKGDVVREFVDACRAGGLKVGLYLSPWDRHEKTYGTEDYNRYFTNQLTELLTQYGTVDEVWFDGACGEGPNGKRQVYDWKAFYGTIRALAPNAVIAISGPDVRWVGNESGVARVGESSVHPGNRDMHGTDDQVWWPAECDVSIRPGWFYHAAEDRQVKSLTHLLDIYFKSVGRNSVMLLNVPPDRNGLFAEPDVKRLREFGAALQSLTANDLAKGGRVTAPGTKGGETDLANIIDGNSQTFWAAPEGATNATLEIAFESARTFNCLSLREPFWLGERSTAYRLEAQAGAGDWQLLARGSVIGSRNLVPVPETTAKAVRLVIESTRGTPAISEIALYASAHVPHRPPASLATHKPAKASNVHPQGTTFGADRAVDGDPETRWATADGTSACWLEVDLGKPETIGRVVIAELTPRVGRFQIEIRDQVDAPWKVAYEGHGNGNRHEHTFAPVTARYVRLNVTEASAPPTIFEFEAYPK